MQLSRAFTTPVLSDPGGMLLDPLSPRRSRGIDQAAAEDEKEISRHGEDPTDLKYG
jgi:hypothetical protein